MSLKYSLKLGRHIEWKLFRIPWTSAKFQRNEFSLGIRTINKIPITCNVDYVTFSFATFNCYSLTRSSTLNGFSFDCFRCNFAFLYFSSDGFWLKHLRFNRETLKCFEPIPKQDNDVKAFQSAFEETACKLRGPLECNFQFSRRSNRSTCRHYHSQ